MADSADVDYELLLRLRVALREFERWSQGQARAAGLTPGQHQLLLCIRGSTARHGPTVGDVAECLLVRHHSAVELVDRAARAGLVTRRADSADARVIRVRLTTKGTRILNRLSGAHVEELRRLGKLLQPIVG
jgi:DNA-binding MarR family transcriptional regulator